MPGAGSRAHAFVADPDSPELIEADRHHLERVLRLRLGDEITVSDGAGRWRRCRFGPELVPAGPVRADPRPHPPIGVAFALTKGERPEWTVQKLTELGADRIVPFTAAHSIVRWTPERAAAHAERWRRVAREAASQCRRTWLPEVEDVQAFASLLQRPGTALAHAGGDPPSLAHALVLVGPEGGWSDEELEAAAGLPRVGLGPHILRAETASMAAAALLSALRAGVAAPAPGRKT
ncbi:MAG: 16S rRNA (uracil(1498)-N(3))-methyltransferase [Actinomycetota bacterium]|nr:16S rRNA (uracil(1498)-N(3))-methyltransferase [Actinomycetota bacterium]